MGGGVVLKFKVFWHCCAFFLHCFMQGMTHSADNGPNCARAVELVVAGPCFVAQCWFGSFLADQLQ